MLRQIRIVEPFRYADPMGSLSPDGEAPGVAAIQTPNTPNASIVLAIYVGWHGFAQHFGPCIGGGWVWPGERSAGLQCD